LATVEAEIFTGQISSCRNTNNVKTLKVDFSTKIKEKTFLNVDKNFAVLKIPSLQNIQLVVKLFLFSV